MSQSQWTAVDEYLNNIGVGEDAVLKRARIAAKDEGLPPIQVSPAQGSLLHLLAKMRGAERVLEVGTLGGYSAIWLARALDPARGHLISLEVDPKHANVASRNVAAAGLTGVVDIRVGAAADTLEKLIAADTEPFDLVFIDADKESYPKYLDLVLRLSKPGTAIIADNVVRGGSVAVSSSADDRVQAVQAYLKAVADDPRLESTVIQTVGEKGYDGFSLARVTSV
ncbi:O-methyltransferase [Salininema proteolyticum]|uniref:O-methyltransferase n=1 Tax=Salininema proteolyticum TaxID=1607685 RepID=A0ABV8U4B8_9ACTN